MTSTFRLSPSKLKVFLDCRLKYYYKYVLSLPDPGNEKARLGSLLHTVLECAGNPLKKRMPLVIETKKSGHLHPRLKAFYDRLYEKEKFEKPLYEDGLKMLENAFLYGFDLVPILAVETKFNVEIGDNIILNGIMDKLQNPTPDTLEVVDYKSGVPFSPLEAEKDLQSYMYLMAVRRLIKGYERFIFTFHFLKNRKCYTVAKSPEKLAKFENFIKAQARAMRNICLSTAKPTRSFKCRWCAYATPAGQFTGCPHVR